MLAAVALGCAIPSAAQEAPRQEPQPPTLIERWTGNGLSWFARSWTELTAATSKSGSAIADITVPGMRALARVPGSVVIGAETCPVVAGTPDCATAARAACVKQGFNSGAPIDVASGRRCRADAVALRVKCKTKTWVTSSMCYN